MPDRNPPAPILATLKRTACALREGGVLFALAGSMAVWAQGGAPSSHDIDLVVQQSDAERAAELLAAAGMRVEWPPEGWLVKAWDGDVLVDLIWAPAGLDVSPEVLAGSAEVIVDGMHLSVLSPTQVVTSRLLALNEGHLDFEGLLTISRGVREQIDWEVLRDRTADRPLARAFLHLVRELGIVPGLDLSRSEPASCGKAAAPVIALEGRR